jgi:hypothetical protein
MCTGRDTTRAGREGTKTTSDAGSIVVAFGSDLREATDSVPCLALPDCSVAEVVSAEVVTGAA